MAFQKHERKFNSMLQNTQTAGNSTKHGVTDLSTRTLIYINTDFDGVAFVLITHKKKFLDKWIRDLFVKFWIIYLLTSIKNHLKLGFGDAPTCGQDI